MNDIKNALAYCGPVLITALKCFVLRCDKAVKYLLNGTGDFEQFKLEAIEGTSERVKKNIFVNENERKKQLYSAISKFELSNTLFHSKIWRVICVCLRFERI